MGALMWPLLALLAVAACEPDYGLTPVETDPRPPRDLGRVEAVVVVDRSCSMGDADTAITASGLARLFGGIDARATDWRALLVSARSMPQERVECTPDTCVASYDWALSVAMLETDHGEMPMAASYSVLRGEPVADSELVVMITDEDDDSTAPAAEWRAWADSRGIRAVSIVAHDRDCGDDAPRLEAVADVVGDLCGAWPHSAVVFP